MICFEKWQPAIPGTLEMYRLLVTRKVEVRINEITDKYWDANKRNPSSNQFFLSLIKTFAICEVYITTVRLYFDFNRMTDHQNKCFVCDWGREKKICFINEPARSIAVCIFSLLIVQTFFFFQDKLFPFTTFDLFLWVIYQSSLVYALSGARNDGCFSAESAIVYYNVARDIKS